MNANLEAGGFWQGRRVALTGASGFVGHHVATLLARLGAHVTALLRATSQRDRLGAAGIECVTAPLDDVDALARGCDGCDFLFHIAGAVDFEGDWLRFHQVNVVGTHNVLTAARRAGVQRVVHTSSIVAVGATLRPHIQDESSPWDLGRLRIPYVTTKRRAEELALAASGPELEVLAVNPACVIGPDDFSQSEFGTLCRRFWRGRIPIYFGGGNNYVDVRDVALGHLLAAQRGRAGERYLLGGTNCVMTAFFTELARAAARPIFRVRVPSLVGHAIGWLSRRGRRRAGRSLLTPEQARLAPLFFYFDCAKARRELDYEPRPLRESVRDAHDFWMPRKKSKSAA
jgi:dihydroflavonol-4-reductase